MKRTKLIFIIMLLLLYIFLICSCQPTAVDNKKKIHSDVKLPPEVAGIWMAVDNPRYSTGPWEFSIRPDGDIEYAVIALGAVRVVPNQTTSFEMKDGQFSTVTAGECVVEYDPQTRELYVSVDVADINIVFFEEQLTGHSQNYFTGKVSEDGKLWKADFIEVFDYGPRFPQDPNDIVAEPMLFEKIEPKKVQ